MTRRAADIEAWSTGDDEGRRGAVLRIKVGALRITIQLDDIARRRLAAALIEPYARPVETSGVVGIAPLRLPVGVREITEETMCCREAPA